MWKLIILIAGVVQLNNATVSDMENEKQCVAAMTSLKPAHPKLLGAACVSPDGVVIDIAEVGK